MAWFMEHRRDVPGGDIRACTSCGSCRGPESAGGGQGVWAIAGDSTQDAAVRGAARLPAATADQTAQVGAVAWRNRRHTERRQAEASEATAHGEADLLAAKRRTPVHRRLHDREGLRPCGDVAWPGDVRSTDACAGRGAGGLDSMGNSELFITSPCLRRRRVAYTHYKN